MATMLFAAKVTAAGTPQNLGASANITLPSIVSGGVTYPAESATTWGFQIVLQGDTANTGNIYVGQKGMVVSTRVGVGAALAPGASLNLGQYGGAVNLDDLWIDATTTNNVVLVTVLG